MGCLEEIHRISLRLESCVLRWSLINYLRLFLLAVEFRPIVCLHPRLFLYCVEGRNR